VVPEINSQSPSDGQQWQKAPISASVSTVFANLPWMNLLLKRFASSIIRDTPLREGYSLVPSFHPPEGINLSGVYRTPALKDLLHQLLHEIVMH